MRTLVVVTADLGSNFGRLLGPFFWTGPFFALGFDLNEFCTVLASKSRERQVVVGMRWFLGSGLGMR